MKKLTQAKSAAKQVHKSAHVKISAKPASSGSAKIIIKPALTESRLPLWAGIIALLLNVGFLPGIGTIIGGRILEGFYQILLYVAGWITFVFFSPGWILILAAWVWGVYSSVQILKNTQRKDMR